MRQLWNHTTKFPLLLKLIWSLRRVEEPLNYYFVTQKKEQGNRKKIKDGEKWEWRCKNVKNLGIIW